MPRKKSEKSNAYWADFPKRLRKLMDEKKYSQETVAKEIDKARQTVSCYMDGTASPDWRTIVKLSEFFDVSTDWLLGLSEYREDNARRYNLADMRFTEKAANALAALSTAEFIASRGEDVSEGCIHMGNAYRVLMKMLEDDKFIEFLYNASAYVQADTAVWANQATISISNGKEFSAPAAFAKDLFWAHCTAPLKECLDKIEFIEKA